MIKLTKVISGYMPPEAGPFECEYCHYFNEPRGCELVEGNIDRDGCCNLFTEKGKAGKPTEELDDEKIELDSDDSDTE
jgi:hypothetical protein